MEICQEHNKLGEGPKGRNGVRLAALPIGIALGAHEMQEMSPANGKKK